MQRRDFIKLSLIASSAILLPSSAHASDVPLSSVNFSKEVYNANAAQVLVIYTHGGASQLAGNLSNIDEIKSKSQSDYEKYFRGITPTANGCWQEAGGTYMEEMMASGDMTLFRTSYSKVRDTNNNKSHGSCTLQNQKGSFDLNRGGIMTNIAQILEANGVVTQNSIMPFVTLEGESNFYAEGDRPLSDYLKAVGLDENLNNPYKRNARAWYYYTQAERSSASDYSNATTGFDPKLDSTMDAMAKSQSTNSKIKEAFDKRVGLSNFIENIKSAVTPDLGADAYEINNRFASQVESAIKILANNPDTKTVSLSTSGLGGWDDHDDARNYVTRANLLFKTLKSGIAHLKALAKENNICIMVFSEFGRNVNLNSAFGWDHGNLQNFYLLGGKNYFTHRGVVGETLVDDDGRINRLYLKPTPSSYSFEHISIAATMYKIFGVTNPEVLTNNNPAITI